jgi:hypothetical protein
MATAPRAEVKGSRRQNACPDHDRFQISELVVPSAVG